jgi:hypothetical protein
MKKFSKLVAVLTVLIASCTADPIDTNEGTSIEGSYKKSKKTARLVQYLTPENPENVYDFAGRLYNELLELYLSGNYPHNTISAISQQIELLVIAHTEGMLLDPQTDSAANFEAIQQILDNPQTQQDQIISKSLMTNPAKISLAGFMDDVLLWGNYPYDTIYPLIVSYESSVIANNALTTEDKRIILTTSSIARYSLYDDDKRKDKDWGGSVGNRIGGVSGALDNPSSAVVSALVTGIMMQHQTE